MTATAFAHRALVAASLYGLGRPPALVVLVDDPVLEETAFARAFQAVEPAHGLVAVVVASTSAAGLLRWVGGKANADVPASFARVAAWRETAARGPVAPAVSAERLRHLAELADRAGLVLVEPPAALALDSPDVRALAPRSATDRAVLATIVQGATARPLLFVPRRDAPKNGLVKVREERLLDGWVARRGGAVEETATATLVGAALAVLRESAGAVRGKELLREARARWAGGASAADGLVLSKALYAAWLDGVLDLYAVDPADPRVPLAL